MSKCQLGFLAMMCVIIDYCIVLPVLNVDCSCRWFIGSVNLVVSTRSKNSII